MLIQIANSRYRLKIQAFFNKLRTVRITCSAIEGPLSVYLE